MKPLAAFRQLPGGMRILVVPIPRLKPKSGMSLPRAFTDLLMVMDFIA